ncbi:MAG: hypothetical protein AAFP17_05205 [Pseudomonadota bacterium]
MRKPSRLVAAAALLPVLAAPGLHTGSASANEFAPQLEALVASDIAPVLSDAALLEALRAQNARNAGLSQAEIEAMDKDWRAQVGAASQPLIEPVLSGPAAERLRAIREASGGIFTEVFVMDAVGLNVAASDVTSDYWQGDEAKWQATYAAGATDPHFGEVELDDSTQSFQSQVSVTVIDPETGDPIGAATFGVNVELLQ